MMKRILVVLALLGTAGAALAWISKKIYPDRWVYVSRPFASNRDVEDMRKIARTASEHGLTGIVLAGMDRISLGTPAYYDRLKRVKEIADSDRPGIIPSGFGNAGGIRAGQCDSGTARGARGPQGRSVPPIAAPGRATMAAWPMPRAAS